MATIQATAPPVPPAPMLATRATVPTGEGWHYEAKWDGARGLIRGFDGHAEIYSRTGTHLSRSFPELCEAMPAGLNGHRAILDGEIVALDARAQPCFQRLQRRLHVARPSAALQTAVPVTLFVFDILHLDGADVTRLSYLERRALLEQLRLDQAGPRIITPPVWSDIDGDIILDVMRQAALEGVVAKRATSPYQAGRRSRFWVKTPIRNAACLVVGGWIPASAQEGAVGSLLVGGHDDATGDLVYCGHITSGFSNRARRTLYELLTQIGCTDPPFTNIYPASDESRAHWVHPVLVGRVEYREYTGRLRHAAWKGIEAADPATAQLPPRR